MEVWPSFCDFLKNNLTWIGSLSTSTKSTVGTIGELGKLGKCTNYFANSQQSYRETFEFSSKTNPFVVWEDIQEKKYIIGFKEFKDRGRKVKENEENKDSWWRRRSIITWRNNTSRQRTCYDCGSIIIRKTQKYRGSKWNRIRKYISRKIDRLCSSFNGYEENKWKD
jgi:hypothetical protein